MVEGKDFSNWPSWLLLTGVSNGVLYGVDWLRGSGSRLHDLSNDVFGEVIFALTAVPLACLFSGSLAFMLLAALTPKSAKEAIEGRCNRRDERRGRPPVWTSWHLSAVVVGVLGGLAMSLLFYQGGT